MSSALAPYSMARTPSAIISPALGPTRTHAPHKRLYTSVERGTKRTHDVDTKDLVCLLLSQDLHEPFGVGIGLGAGVGTEVEFADVVFGSGGLELLLSLADPGDLGVRVDDGGDGSVVDVSVSGFQEFGSSDTYAQM